ncbi:hypothetical protein KDW_22190 [Dictyobacter vulcani]|uniref:HAMP domain-containing protein n=1 Tax=Dictyobacter vulcani TaxID=2607529 RepID=A0A5J4KNQ7_9CHLR|nr:hypothetical protein [Dictyobacter vulcani]GER88057.1 hypothetical protein KDW_22190 [Dictyobacter vulcani]
MSGKSAQVEFNSITQLVGTRSGFWGGWLNLTAPPRNEQTMASPQLRERMRKAELTAYFLFVVAFFVIFDLILALAAGHFMSVIYVLIFMAFLGLLAFLNRTGRTQTSGVLLVSAMIISIIFVIAFTPSTTSAIDLFPTYDFFAYPIALGSIFIPRKFIFPLTIVAIAFIIFNLLFQQHAVDIERVKGTSKVIIWLIRPAAVLLVIAIVNWLGMRSVEQSLLRADRAEELVAAQNQVALQAHEIAQQKANLEGEIAQILMVHREAATGNYAVRAPVRANDAIWQIGRSLNNLLARYEQFAHDQRELSMQQEDIEKVAFYIESIRRGQKVTPPLCHSLAGKRILTALGATVLPTEQKPFSPVSSEQKPFSPAGGEQRQFTPPGVEQRPFPTATPYPWNNPSRRLPDTRSNEAQNRNPSNERTY